MALDKEPHPAVLAGRPDLKINRGANLPFAEKITPYKRAASSRRRAREKTLEFFTFCMTIDYGTALAVNKLALNAYCTVAQKESSSLADGKVSYKQVADAASTQALAEHPNVYRDSFAWKAKIVALLDQYGDEPIGQLCSEDPGSHASAND
jgi:hypothetical protein